MQQSGTAQLRLFPTRINPSQKQVMGEHDVSIKLARCVSAIYGT